MKKANSQVPSEPVFDYRTIKSFKEACKKTDKRYWLNRLAIFLIKLFLPREFGKAIAAIYRLMIVFKAVNDGWRPDWNDRNQPKWSPWFWVLPSGVGFSDSITYDDDEDADLGSRLCCETSAKLRYIMDTFEEEFKEFMLY